MATLKRKNSKSIEVLAGHIRELAGKQVKIGWFKGTVYPDGTPVSYVAAIQEFGVPSKNIPPRPFMRPTVIREQKNWIKLLADGARHVLKGNWSATEVLKAVGHKAKDDVTKSIDLVISPPLKPATIMARARRRAKRVRGKPLITPSLQKPLIDTTKMISSISYHVEDSK